MIKKKKTFSLFLRIVMLGIVLAMISGTVHAYSVPQDLKIKHFYSFDTWLKPNILNDATGVYDLTNGTRGYRNTTSCFNGACIYFAKSHTYTTNATKYVNTYGNISIAFWFRGYGGSGDTSLIKTTNAQQKGTFDIQIRQSSNELIIRVYNTSVGSGFLSFISSSAIQSGKSYHAVMVFNGTHIIGYINGTKTAVSTVLRKNNFFTNFTGIKISYGANLGTTGYGNIDDIYIFNRSITESEIYALYKNHYSSSMLNSVSYNNYVTKTAINYSRNLSYNINYTCYSDITTRLVRYINGSVNNTIVLTCINTTSLYSGNYNHKKATDYKISFKINNSYITNSSYTGNRTIKPDLFKPNIMLANISMPSAFTTGANSLNISLKCNDSGYPNTKYKIVLNSAVVYTTNYTSQTLLKNITTPADGSNQLILSCGDPFGNSTQYNQFTASYDLLVLIEEKTGRRFQVTNVTSARVYIDGNTTSYDFKANNRNNVSYSTLGNNTKLRIELGYKDGNLISRYIDTSLTSSPVRICANNETIIHYQQLVISGSEKVVAIKNSFSNCYIVYDTTRFAYQSGYFILSWSIDSMYNIYGRLNNVITQLSNLDGRVENTIYLDKLILESQRVQRNIIGAGLAISKLEDGSTDTRTIQVTYLNLLDDIDSINLTIIRKDTREVLLTQSTFSNMTYWTSNFNYASIANLTNNTALQAIVQYVADGDLYTMKRDFTIGLGYPFLSSQFGFAIAFLLLLFGFTLTKTSSTFGWIGIFVLVAGIGILGYTAKEWYVYLLMAIHFIILVYTLMPLFYQSTTEAV